MDLLEEQYSKKKNTKSKGQKIILSLLIISSILLVISICLIVYLKLQGTTKPYSIMLNGEKLDIKENMIIDFEESKYISLKDFAKAQGYNFFNGVYGTDGEDKDKCYIDTGIDIVGFTANSVDIYKVNEETDNETLSLTKAIKNYDNNLYINVDDLRSSLQPLYCIC